jgi:hypothetical protein
MPWQTGIGTAISVSLRATPDPDLATSTKGASQAARAAVLAELTPAGLGSAPLQRPCYQGLSNLSPAAKSCLPTRRYALAMPF